MSDPGKLRILRLTLKREYFARIVGGKKKKEYRKRTDYWKTRLEGREYDIVRFRNGYTADVPEMDVELKGVVKEGREYVIKLGAVLRSKNWPP